MFNLFKIHTYFILTSPSYFILTSPSYFILTSKYPQIILFKYFLVFQKFDNAF